MTPKRRYSHYLAGAKKRNLSFDISFDEFILFWGKSCFYCGEKIETIGLDRIDSLLGYSLENIRSCCAECNRFKSNLSEKLFYKLVSNIKKNAKDLNLIKKAIVLPRYPDSNKLRESNSRYKIYKYTSKKYKRDFLLSKLQFFSFWKKDCFYCGIKMGGVGIDRVDNKIGYVEGNCVPCCKTCNWMKSDLNIKQFKAHINKINNYLNL